MNPVTQNVHGESEIEPEPPPPDHTLSQYMTLPSKSCVETKALNM